MERTRGLVDRRNYGKGYRLRVWLSESRKRYAAKRITSSCSVAAAHVRIFGWLCNPRSNQDKLSLAGLVWGIARASCRVSPFAPPTTLSGCCTGAGAGSGKGSADADNNYHEKQATFQPGQAQGEKSSQRSQHCVPAFAHATQHKGMVGIG